MPGFVLVPGPRDQASYIQWLNNWPASKFQAVGYARATSLVLCCIEIHNLRNDWAFICTSRSALYSRRLAAVLLQIEKDAPGTVIRPQ